MGSKINLKARIERHSRILLEQGKLSYKKNHKTVNYWYKAVVFTLVFLVPIYPVFASFVNDTTEYDFNRSNIDESSIIMSSDFWIQETGIQGNDLFIQSKDSYLYINAPIDAERDVSGSTEVVEYTIQQGESIASIANRFKVSRETIYWANGFDSSHILHPGDTIKIPPVSGLIYEVKSGDTLSEIAKKYDIDEEKIMRQNLLLSASDIKAGQNLIIPWARKIEPKPAQTPTSTKTYTKSTTTTTGYSFSTAAASEYVNTSGSYQLVWREPQHTFYWGNCTWYVGQYKNVDWGGNANQWLYNAKKKGHATGNIPTLGSIVVFNGTGYNPRYGHVGIVTDISGDHIIISDMNYRKLGEVTTRKVPTNDRAIMGYIYVD